VKCLVVGLGKLGLPLSLLLAKSGHQVAGYDGNFELIESLKNRKFTSVEPGLNELLDNERNIDFYHEVPILVDGLQAVFIIVPTPSDENGAFSNELLIEAIRNIGPTIRHHLGNEIKSRIVVNIVSTVMPGSCDGEIQEALEEASGFALGPSLTITYSPEFIALGSVIKDMQNPDMHLIGESDSWGGQIVLECLQSISRKKIPLARMSLIEAELVKISINNFVTTKISFANSLLQISRSLGNLDIDKITAAVGLDSRIGPKYIKGATPYGGPCFPRDTRALAYLFQKYGLESSLPETTEYLNNQHSIYLANLIANKMPNKSSRIGFCGISYKMGSDVVEDSPAIKIMEYLSGMGYRTSFWDDEGSYLPKGFGITSIAKKDLHELFLDNDLIVLTRPIRNQHAFEVEYARTPRQVINLWQS